MRPCSLVGLNRPLTPMPLMFVPARKGKIRTMIAILVSIGTDPIILIVTAITNGGMGAAKGWCAPMINRAFANDTIVFVTGVISIFSTGVGAIFVQFFKGGNHGGWTIGVDCVVATKILAHGVVIIEEKPSSGVRTISHDRSMIE